MKIGILIAGILPEKLIPRFGSYGAMYEALLDGLGYSFRHYDVRNGELPASTDEVDAWLVTGSKNGAYEDEPWINALKECLRNILKSNQPIVGICFGHQLLADVMGGAVEKFDGGWTIGRTPYHLEDGTKLHAMAWHQDQVLALPSDAIRLASADNCENAMMLVGGTVLGIQPHPEFDASIVLAALDAYKDNLPSDLSKTALRTANEPVAGKPLAAMIDAFLMAKDRTPTTLKRTLLHTLSQAKAA